MSFARKEIPRFCKTLNGALVPDGSRFAFRTFALVRRVRWVDGRTMARSSRRRAGARDRATQRPRWVDHADVPSGFTHIPTIVIAERLSEEIASVL
jgi:hypothetical protein